MIAFVIGPLYNRLERKRLEAEQDREIRRASEALREERSRQIEKELREAPATEEKRLLPTDRIVREVMDSHGVSFADFYGPKRLPHLTAARREIAWRLFEETPLSFPRIALHIGIREHSTAIYHVAMHAYLNGITKPPPNRARLPRLSVRQIERMKDGG